MRHYSLYDINPRHKLEHLLADDLFKQDSKLVFDARTGKMIGSIEVNNFHSFNDEEEVLPQPEPINEKQLSLF